MGSLHQFVHSEEEISLHRKFLMGRDIARGMFYLHSLNPVIIHRGEELMWNLRRRHHTMRSSENTGVGVGVAQT